MKLLLPSQHILLAAKSLEQEYRVLKQDEAEQITNEIFLNYTSGRGGYIWESLKNSASRQDSDGWMLMDDFLTGMQFIVFFDTFEDRTMIEFASGSKIVPIIADCPGFEFYVTDQKTWFLLCFNHHDFLIGAGSAIGWISKIGTDQDEKD